MPTQSSAGGSDGMSEGGSETGDGSEASTSSASGSTSDASAEDSSSASDSSGEPPCIEGVGPWREELLHEDAFQLSNAVVDGDGRMHVVVDAGLLHAVSGEEGAWEVIEVGTPQLWTLALSIDAEGFLHLGMGAYHWMYETDYWTNRSGSWERFAVADDGGPTSIAVHPDGTPYMLHLTWPDVGYRLVVDPIDPATQQLGVTPYGESAPALALDGEGRVWFGFATYTRPGVPEIAIGRLEDDGTLAILVNEPHEFLAAVTSLVFDAAGTLHVAYVGNYTRAYHGQLDASGWSSTLLTEANGFQSLPVVAVDLAGNPSVVVTEGESFHPVYLRRTGDAWQSELIAPSPRQVTGLLIDDIGAAHTFSLGIDPDAGRGVYHSTNHRSCD